MSTGANPTAVQAAVPNAEANAPRVVRCKWCNDVVITGASPSHRVFVELVGLYEFASVNYHQVIIQDGICKGCRAEKFGDVPKKVVTHDLAQK